MPHPAPEPVNPARVTDLALAVVAADRFPHLATVDGDQPRVRPVSPVRTDRFTVFVDHTAGVDHSLCVRVTDVLREYLREYAIDVSSPGPERPLRKPAHFERAVGHRVTLRTAHEVHGKTKFKGEVVADFAGVLRGGEERPTASWTSSAALLTRPTSSSRHAR